MVYVALERAQLLKVAAVILLFVVGAIFAVGADAWADVPQVVTRPRIPVEVLGLPVLLGALAFAGAGGGQNLVQANWIRDKGAGMGAYVPRLVSPITGQPEAAPSTGYVFEPTTENLARWKGWWKFANLEQIFTFVLITFLTILFTSLLAYSAVFGREGLANNIGFIKTQGEVLAERSGAGRVLDQVLVLDHRVRLPLCRRAGIVDYTSRMAADVLKTSYLRQVNQSKMYAGLVWGLTAVGVVVLMVGFDQPIVLLVIEAVVGGFMMFIYSGLLIPMNRRRLPPPIRIRGIRLVMLIWAIVLFGTLSILTFQAQIARLLGGG